MLLARLRRYHEEEQVQQKADGEAPPSFFYGTRWKQQRMRRGNSFSLAQTNLDGPSTRDEARIYALLLGRGLGQGFELVWSKLVPMGSACVPLANPQVGPGLPHPRQRGRLARPTPDAVFTHVGIDGLLV